VTIFSTLKTIFLKPEITAESARRNNPSDVSADASNSGNVAF